MEIQIFIVRFRICIRGVGEELGGVFFTFFILRLF